MHGIDNRIITEDQKRLLAKVKDENHVMFWQTVWCTKNLCLNQKFYRQVLERLLKQISSVRLQCQERERQLVLFACKYPCSFCHCSEVFPGKLWCGDHPPCTPTAIYLSPKVKNCSHRKISRCHVIKQNITAELNAVCWGAFKVCFVQVLEQYEVLAIKRDYY